MMKTFTLFWKGSPPEVIEGTDIADAWRRAGLSYGTLQALDYYTEA